MSKRKDHVNDTPDDQTPPPLPEGDADGLPELTPVEADGPPSESKAELASLLAERDELKERLLRVSADYQNFARRQTANIQTARQQQTMDMAKAMLNVVDHFDRALQADPEKISAKSLQQGVQIVRDELLTVLERFGVIKQTVNVGDEFVPGQHEAVMQQAVEGLPPHRVGAVLQNGYVLDDKPLRPAKVSVTA